MPFDSTGLAKKFVQLFLYNLNGKNRINFLANPVLCEMEFVSAGISQRGRVLAHGREDWGHSVAANGSCDLKLVSPLQKALSVYKMESDSFAASQRGPP